MEFEKYSSSDIKNYAVLESAQPFSFLNGIYSKLCKLDIELYRIHTKNSFL